MFTVTLTKEHYVKSLELLKDHANARSQVCLLAVGIKEQTGQPVIVGLHRIEVTRVIDGNTIIDECEMTTQAQKIVHDFDYGNPIALPQTVEVY